MSLSPGSDPASPPSSSTNEKTPRTKNACAVCFQKKVRCTGERPRCNRCVSKGVECVYVEGGNSRVSKKRASVSTNPAPARRARVSAPPQASEPRPAPSGEVVVATPPPPPPPPVRQPYFRWIGLTAVAPPLRGASFRALSVAVSQAAAAEKSNATPGPSTASVPPLQPPAETSPSTTVATFYETLESFLPFTPRGETEEMIAAGTFSEMVLAAMEALATRVRPQPGVSAEASADRAKALILPLLGLPTVEVVFGLLLLAYHEHGEDRDSGLWIYSGMAIRMAIDLGLHKPFVAGNEEVCALRSRVFWAVVCLDRIISCGTGRQTTIPLAQIEVDLPPPRTDIVSSNGTPLVDPFPFLCRLLLLLGQVTDSMNHSNPTARSPRSPRPLPRPFQNELAQFQADLPPELYFNIHNFQAFASAKQSQCFLLLSIWHQAVLLAVHEAGLLFPTFESGEEYEYGERALSQSCAVSISDMLCFADLILPESFMCTPVLSQAILMAGRASLSLNRTLPANSPPHHEESLRRSATICESILRRIQQRWRGLSWHNSSLDSCTRDDEDVDLSSGEAAIRTEDRGMVARAKVEELTRRWLAEELSSSGPRDGPVAGFGVSLWGVTAEPAESSFAVLHSGRSSPLLWNPSLAGGSGGAGGRGTALAGFGLATNSLSIAEDFYHEGLTAEEWFNWPPPVGV